MGYLLDVVLILLLLIAVAVLVWGWNNYVRIVPLTSDKFGIFKNASKYENPDWVKKINERGGMTRTEWASFIDRHYNPPGSPPENSN